MFSKVKLNIETNTYNFVADSQHQFHQILKIEILTYF
jgi:hypothetical protein